MENTEALLKRWFNFLDESGCQDALCKYVLSATEPKIAELTLIRHLESQGIFGEIEALPAMLQLFAKHFLVRRSLYASLPRLREQGFTLLFDPSGVERMSINVADSAQASQLTRSSQKLIADFYGESEQLFTATENTVTDLLTKFWQRFAAYEKGESAYAALGIGRDSDWPTIQSAYRKLAAETHPDKGGSAEDFAAIKAAYDDLKKIKGSRLK